MDKDEGNNKAAVLVVEDETLIRLWAADLLQENGFSVLDPKDGNAALKILESRPDVKSIFTDVQMPGLLMEWSRLARFMLVGRISSW
jgi:CheY-like chemotaxis protein